LNSWKWSDGGVTADKVFWFTRCCERTGGKGYAKKLMAQMSRIFRLGKVVCSTTVAKSGQINPSCLIFRTYFPPHTYKIATIFAPLDALEFESIAMHRGDKDASDEMKLDKFAAFSSGW